MFKTLKSVLFVIGIVMVFTAQVQHPDDKGQQHAPANRPASTVRHVPVARPAALAHNNQARPRLQSRARVAPTKINVRAPQPVQSRPFQRPPQERDGPRVYAFPAAVPVANDRLLNHQRHNHWQPRYNFYGNQYHFYPYVNIATEVELSTACVSVGFDGQTYYYDQGTFYQQDGQGHYFAISPPIGIIVNALPPQARQIEVNGQIFYRYKGVFYVQVAGGYQVVGPVESDSDGS